MPQTNPNKPKHATNAGRQAGGTNAGGRADFGAREIWHLSLDCYVTYVVLKDCTKNASLTFDVTIRYYPDVLSSMLQIVFYEKAQRFWIFRALSLVWSMPQASL